MSRSTSIEWTDRTWNPVTGCDAVSAGCDNCYARTMAIRLKRMGNPRYQHDGRPPTSGPGFGVTMHADLLDLPKRWRKPSKIFINSMSDLLHPRVTDRFIKKVFGTVLAAPLHEFQLLTKRPRRLVGLRDQLPWPPNLWVGVSIENNDHVWRADLLRQVPAAIRFISFEPLLGPVPTLSLTAIHWVVSGGESGPRSRPVDVEWVREIRDRCLAERVPFFHKQWGGRTAKSQGRTLDGVVWDQFPEARRNLK